MYNVCFSQWQTEAYSEKENPKEIPIRNKIVFFLNDVVTLFMSFCFHFYRYEQYVEDAYVAFLKQKGQAEQVNNNN